MKVIKLSASNFKKLKAIEISPDPDVVKLSGDNEAGKSSILDSIWCAMGGKKYAPERPIRDGERESIIELELDDIKIRRRFKLKKGGGWDLAPVEVIAKADNTKISRPQDVLDSLAGSLTFDPLAFADMKEKEQVEILKGLTDLGPALVEITAEGSKLFTERATARKEKDAAFAKIMNQQYHEAPDEEISVTDLAGKLEVGNKIISARKVKITELEKLEGKGDYSTDQTSITLLNGQIATAESEISRLEANLDNLRKLKIEKEELILRLNTEINSEGKHLPDVQSIKTQMESAESVNKLVRFNIDLKKKYADNEASGQAWAKLDEAVKANNEKREQLIMNAKFPVDGLGFGNDDSLLYDGVPFSQASRGAQIKISTLIAMALNPKLRIMLIRQASLMADRTLDIIKEQAKAQDFQLWLEYVDTSGEIGIYIEDGEVK